jgi:hypothetical protein
MAADWKAALSKVAPERRAALEAALAEADGFVKELEAGYMRQEDYSKNMDAAKAAREAWEAEKALAEETLNKAQDNYNSLYADWTSTAAEKKLAKEALEASQKELNELKAKANIDPEKFLTVDQYNAKMAEVESGRIAYTTEALDLVEDIASLTKTRIKPGTFIREALASGKPPEQYAEEKYQLSAKREEQAKAEREEHEKRIRDDEREKVVAQYANPATRPMEPSKEPFYVPSADKTAAKQPWELTETPADEVAMLSELTKARIQ